MIKEEIIGDIFKTDLQTIVIPINKVGALGRGLALYAKKRWPYIEPIYKKGCYDKIFETQLITISIDNNQQLLLLPTKNHWKEDSTESLIKTSLGFLIRDYKELNIKSLAIPMIGCGNGNLNSAMVINILYEFLDPTELLVKIYKN